MYQEAFRINKIVNMEMVTENSLCGSWKIIVKLNKNDL